VRISIIVPVLNEAAIIRGFLEHVRAAASGAEIIVVDGGSSDETLALARDLADDAINGPRGRAQQMNAGALRARGEILWFLHVDSRISAASIAAIEDALSDASVVGGCFRLEIVPSRWIYRVRDAFGNCCVDVFRIALGDRGLFCRKGIFFAVGGYPHQPLLEDAAFYRKLRWLGRVRQLPIRIQTSGRRYEALGPIRTSLFYMLIMTLYFARVRLRVLERMVNWFAAKKASDRFLFGTPIRTRPTIAGS
jgi:rSAM/selenodomain-associated transferase 2